MAEVISTAASDKVISTVTAEHLLHSTTTTHTILANEQHGLTKTITSMVHTDVESIQQADEEVFLGLFKGVAMEGGTSSGNFSAELFGS